MRFFSTFLFPTLLSPGILSPLLMNLQLANFKRNEQISGTLKLALRPRESCPCRPQRLGVPDGTQDSQCLGQGRMLLHHPIHSEGPQRAIRVWGERGRGASPPPPDPIALGLGREGAHASAQTHPRGPAAAMMGNRTPPGRLHSL